jgi:hypothetical protein
VDGAVLTRWLLTLLAGLWNRRAMIISPVSIEMLCRYSTWMAWPTIRFCSHGADPFLYIVHSLVIVPKFLIPSSSAVSQLL